MRPSILLLSCTFACGCAEPSAPALEQRQQALLSGPEIPAILPDVHLTHNAGAYDYTYPVLPPFRTSADGRIGVDMKKRDPRIYLISPEILTEPVTDPAAAPGAKAVAMQWPALPRTAFYDPGEYTVGDPRLDPEHRTICDNTPQFGYGANTELSPHPCDPTNPKYADPVGTTDDQDCYDLTMITSVQFTDAVNGNMIQLWGTPMQVIVDDPKKATATISDVIVGTPVAGSSFHVNSMFEPMITNDGRLLVARVAKSNRDPNDGSSRGGDKLDVVYGTYGTEHAPCDVTRFDTLHPISHAHHDPDMFTAWPDRDSFRYGIAAYPLRDPVGDLIADGDDMQVSYPWVDRAGANLFFTTLDATLYNNDGTGTLMQRYGARCFDAGCTEPVTVAEGRAFENSENFRGIGFAGLWSHGKMVLIDTVVNNIDFGLGREDDEQLWLDIYAPGTNPNPGSAPHVLDATGEVRIGTGRDNGAPIPDPLTTENANFMESFEQLFNYNEYMRPLTMRDVVWTLNTGKVSAELAFDDYLDPNALIVAEMGGALDHEGAGAFPLHYYDGFEQVAEAVVVGTAEDVRFQNAATALDWAVPAYGLAEGDVRLEPVAMGGIEGKGAWLDGVDDAIAFTIDPQPQAVDDRAWYLSVFLDARFADDGIRRQLFTFPDDSKVVLVGRSVIDYEDPLGAVLGSVSLGALALKQGGFSHLGFVLDYPNARTDLYVDGFAYARTNGVALDIDPGAVPGTLRIGDAPADAVGGFVGWIDEIKLLAHAPGMEVKCNHARGTLMGVTAAVAAPWRDIALAYPNPGHTAISNQLAAAGRPTFPKYVCFHDYQAPIRANPRFATDPAMTPVREDLLFPEGPLEFNVERPDSSANTFCLSCHHVGGKPGLDLDALTAGSIGTELQNDLRRQPMMPPRVMFGNVPAWFFPAGPAFDLHTIDHALDRYVFP